MHKQTKSEEIKPKALEKKQKEGFWWGREKRGEQGYLYARQDQTCEYSMMTIQKKVIRPVFSVFPNKYMHNSLKRNMGQNKNKSS